MEDYLFYQIPIFQNFTYQMKVEMALHFNKITINRQQINKYLMSDE
jgi:hypothetical protein